RRDLAGMEVEVDAVQRHQRAAPGAVDLADAAQRDRRRRLLEGEGAVGHQRNTMLGSSRVTLRIEMRAAPTHMTSVRTSMPKASSGGSRIAGPPPSRAARMMAMLMVMPRAKPAIALRTAWRVMTP